MSLDPSVVQALRDAKALLDEGILNATEFAAKKKELLAPAPASAPPPAAPPAAAAAKPKPAAKKPAAKKEPASKQSEGGGKEKKEKKAAKAAELTLQDAGPDGVLVTGPGTFRAKSILSANGGSWSKALKAWVFGAGTAESTAAVLRASTSPPVALTVAEGGAGAKTAREGSLASAKADALAAGAAAGAGATVNVRAHKKAILVEGETKKINDLLRALEGSWNRKLGGWVFPGGKRDEVLAALRADPTNVVQEDAASPSPAAEPKAEGAPSSDSKTKAGRDVPAPPPPPDAPPKRKSDVSSSDLLDADDPKRRRESVDDAEVLPDAPASPARPLGEENSAMMCPPSA